MGYIANSKALDDMLREGKSFLRRVHCPLEINTYLERPSPQFIQAQLCEPMKNSEKNSEIHPTHYPPVDNKLLRSMGAVFPDLRLPNSGSTLSESDADSRRVDHILQRHGYGLEFAARTANNEKMRFVGARALGHMVVSRMCFAGTGSKEANVASVESQRMSIALSLGKSVNPLGNHWLTLR